MGQHWRNRYVEMMLNAHETSSLVKRTAYLQLAEHYQALAKQFERRPSL